MAFIDEQEPSKLRNLQVASLMKQVIMKFLSLQKMTVA
jgi:hypothetical protein